MSKKSFEHKICSRLQLIKKLSLWKQDKLNICFTNGCFDVLHVGHVKYLSEARSHADILVVGVNSDSSVKRLNKGPNRPINNEDSRALLLSALEFVDCVVVFDEDTPDLLIQEIIPAVLVKGGDYDPEEANETHPKYIVGRDHVINSGGRVETIDLVKGYSTTEILKKLNP